MDMRKLALVAGGLLVSLSCTLSQSAAAEQKTVPPTAVLLNPKSGEITDVRHSSKDGMEVQYDEICMATHNERLVFWRQNKPVLVLEYFPAPAPILPNGQKGEQTCPTVGSLAAQVAFDSAGQFRFIGDNNLVSTASPTTPVPSSEHPHSTLRARIYLAADGHPISEQVFDIDRHQVKVAHHLDDGSYEETAYFPDKSIAHHRITSKTGLVTAEELNAPGGLPLTSTLSTKESILTTKFDEKTHKVVFRDTHLPDGKASSLEAFYPGTDKLRYQATYDGSKTEATFFRLDGTIERKQSLNAYNTTVRYMDATGLVPLYEQVWSFNNPSGKVTDFVMSSMSELNAKGEEVKQFTVSDDHKYISQEARRNVTVGGVTYPSVFYKYDSDGLLTEVQYVTPGSTPNPPPVPHTAAEKIKLVVDANELKHQPFENLPVPRQIIMDFGH